MRVTATMPEMKSPPSPYENVKEYEELMRRYATITLDEIKELWDYMPYDVPRRATGYGTIGTCTLCMAVHKNIIYPILSRVDMNTAANDPCNKCVWASPGGLIGHGLRYRRITGNDSVVMVDNVPPCTAGANGYTYNAIQEADDSGAPEDILKAFRARAKYMQSRIDELNNKGLI